MTEQLKPPLITLTGLTSAGKTALLRTFLRDSEIGDINAGTGTTGIVNDYPLYLENDKDTLFVICDTPGFQNIRGLTDLLNDRHPDRDLETLSIQEIYDLIPKDPDNPTASPFRHDQLSWDQIRKSDTVLAVIDVTEDPDSDGTQSLLLSFWKLIQKEKSLIVLLNKRYCVQDGDSLVEKWRKKLEKYGLEPLIEYDAHYRDLNAESTLFNLLADLYPSLRRRFMKKKERRLAEEERRRQEAIQKTAAYLLKLAKTRKKLGEGKEEQSRYESEKAEKKLIAELREAEEKFVWEITKIWGFDSSIVSDVGNFNIYSHRIEESLEKQRIAKGAAVGAVIDIPFGGFSLGAGSLIGAAAGGVVGKAYDLITKKWHASSGKNVFFIPDIKFLNLALDRSLGLLRALASRGHGTPAETTIKLGLMPIVCIPSAIDQLQKIATSDWSRRILSLPTAVFDNIRRFASIDYAGRDIEKLSQTLSDFLSDASFDSDLKSLSDRRQI